MAAEARTAAVWLLLQEQKEEDSRRLSSEYLSWEKVISDRMENMESKEERRYCVYMLAKTPLTLELFTRFCQPWQKYYTMCVWAWMISTACSFLR